MEGEKKDHREAEGQAEKQNRSSYRYRVDSMEEKPDGQGREAAAVYRTDSSGRPVKKQGEYTLEDYLALPEDERWELIDGHLIRMETPTTEHQIISGMLHVAFFNCIKEHAAACKVLAAPTDVQLDMDDRTIVEPDLIILCDMKKLRRKRIIGAPDLLVEILSPSTHSKDMVLKNRKYQRAGVREYWMVEPKARQVIVNIFENDRGEFRSRIYDFDEEVPVWISEGRCRIDLAPIGRELDEIYGDEDAEKT